MKRRNFIKTITSGGLLSATGILNSKPLLKKESNSTPTCKITILKTTVHHDLYEKYRGIHGKPCPVFHEGQELSITSQYRMPKGFCHWAWADIRPFIQAVWHDRKEPVVTCCTDGYRPVIMKIERK